MEICIDTDLGICHNGGVGAQSADHINLHGVNMNKEQREATIALDNALSRATELGLLDIFAAGIHPDYINQFCDEVRRMRDVSEVLA